MSLMRSRHVLLVTVSEPNAAYLIVDFSGVIHNECRINKDKGINVALPGDMISVLSE